MYASLFHKSTKAYKLPVIFVFMELATTFTWLDCWKWQKDIYIYHWYIWNYYKKASEIIYISIYSMYITHSMWEGIFSFAATRSSNTWTRSFALSCMMSSLWTSASMLSTGSIPELVLLVERYHLWHCRFGYLKLCGFPRIEEEPKTNQFYVINHAWTNSYKYV